MRVSEKTSRKGLKKIAACVTAAASAVSVMAAPVSAIDPKSSSLSSDEKYYVSAVTKTQTAFVDAMFADEAAAAAAPDAAAALPAKSAGKATVKLNITKDGAALMGLQDKAEIKGTVYFKAGEDGMGVKATTKINGSDFLDPTVIMNNDAIYAKIAGISPLWIYTTPEEMAQMAAGMLGDDAGAMLGNMPAPGAGAASAPTLSKKQTKKIVKKYSDLHLKHVKNVKLKKNVTKKASAGFSNTFTVAESTYTGKELEKYALDITKTLKKDKELAALWNSTSAAGQSYDDLFKELEIPEGSMGDGTYTLSTYIDSDQIVKGIELTDENNKNTFSFILLTKNSKNEITCSSKSEDGSSFSYVFDTDTSKNKLNCSGKIKMKDVSDGSSGNISISIKNIDLTGKNPDGEVKVTVKTKDANGQALDVKNKVTSSKDGVKCTFNMDVDKKSVLKLTATAKECSYDSVKLPEPAKNVSLASEEELTKFIGSIDTTALSSRIALLSPFIDAETLGQLTAAVGMLSMMG